MENIFELQEENINGKYIRYVTTEDENYITGDMEMDEDNNKVFVVKYTNVLIRKDNIINYQEPVGE